MSEEQLTALSIAIGVMKREGIHQNAQVLKDLRTELSLRASGDGGKSEAAIDCGAFYARDMDRRLAKLDVATPAESADLEALRRDAERWKWLKMFSTSSEQDKIMRTRWGEWDAYADAAIAAKKEKGK